MRRRGFTMIELLNIIVIITILASILFPVFSGSREKARSTACKSNLMQIALAMHLYAEDWGGRFPPGPTDANVAKQIYPYVKNVQIFSCPSVKGWTTFRPPPDVWWEKSWEGPEAPLGYKFSKGLTTDSPRRERLIWDWTRVRSEFFQHNGGANVAFLDGSARWISRGEWLRRGWPLPPRELPPPKGAPGMMFPPPPEGEGEGK